MKFAIVVLLFVGACYGQQQPAVVECDDQQAVAGALSLCDGVIGALVAIRDAAVKDGARQGAIDALNSFIKLMKDARDQVQTGRKGSVDNAQKTLAKVSTDIQPVWIELFSPVKKEDAGTAAGAREVVNRVIEALKAIANSVRAGAPNAAKDIEDYNVNLQRIYDSIDEKNPGSIQAAFDAVKKVSGDCDAILQKSFAESAGNNVPPPSSGDANWCASRIAAASATQSVSAGGAAVGKIGEQLATVIQIVIQAVNGLLATATGTVQASLREILGFLYTLLNTVYEILESIQAGANPATALSGLNQVAAAVAVLIQDLLKIVVGAALTILSDSLQAVFGIAASIQDVARQLGITLSTVVNGVTDTVTGVVNNALNVASKLPKNLAISEDLIPELTAAIEDLSRNLLSEVINAAGGLTQTVSGLVSQALPSVLSAITGLFGGLDLGSLFGGLNLGAALNLGGGFNLRGYR